MRALNEAAKGNFLKSLDHGLFVTRWAFDVSFNDSTSGEIVRCVYRDDPDSYFAIVQPPQAGSVWRVLESPGRNFTTEEVAVANDYSTAAGWVTAWIDRVIALKIRSRLPEQDDRSDLRKNLEAKANALSEPNEPFTQAELDDWTAKLQTVVEGLRSLEAENSTLKRRLDGLQGQLTALHDQGATVPKRTWLKAAGNKVLDVLTDGLKVGTKMLAEDATKKLIEYLG